MSFASYSRNPPAQLPAAARAAAQAYLTVTDWAAQCHPFAYQFGDTAYNATPFGCKFDGDYSTTLWTSIRMLVRDISISPDVIRFALEHGLRQPPPIFRFPFVDRVNILDSLFRDVSEAREFVTLVQHSGREALDWVVTLCRFLEQESVRAGAALPEGHNSLLSYYHSLTWRDDDAAANSCRAVVPYTPPPPPPAAGATPGDSPMVYSGGAGAYSPLRPQVLPFPNRALPVSAPVSAATVVLPAAAPATTSDLRRLFRALLGQEGVAGLKGVDTQSVQELLSQLDESTPAPMDLTEPTEVIEIE